MKRTLRFAAVALLAIALFGCGPIDFFVMKTTQLFQGPPKTKPAFGLEGKTVVILVDAGNQDLLEVYPTVRYRVAQAVAQELDRQRAAARIVSPRDVMTLSQTDQDFNRKSAVEIGRHFEVDTVVHLVIQNYQLAAAVAGESYNGQADLGLRVIDVAAAAQVFPDLERLHPVGVRSDTGITGDRAEVERKLLDALALKVGQVFAAYEVDALPRKAEVK
jgi:hypothetical protein